MSALRHTPGPWVNPSKYPSEVERADGKTIASCWHEHCVGAEITLTDVADCSLEESAANARMIAAAPEMLEALKAACDEIADLRVYANNHGAMYDDETFAEGLAAISKAEGRQ